MVVREALVGAAASTKSMPENYLQYSNASNVDLEQKQWVVVVEVL